MQVIIEKKDMRVKTIMNVKLLNKAYYKSSIGLIEIVGTEDKILSLDFIEEASLYASLTNLSLYSPLTRGDTGGLQECIKQIDEYFKGIRKQFSLNVQIQGTDFQKKVWQELIKIPFGKTVSYLDIATAIGNEKSVRAVGGAISKNKTAVIIPCHRVIGSNGTLTGFASGLWRKDWLLKHEKQHFS